VNWIKFPLSYICLAVCKVLPAVCACW